MPLTYTIIKDLGLVYVRYWGVTDIRETTEMFARYTRDPDFDVNQKHLIDLKNVVEYERSFTELMKQQARKADVLAHAGPPTLMVYYAPNRLSMTLARNVLKSWDGLGMVIGRIAERESQALEMLGIDGRSFAELPLKRA